MRKTAALPNTKKRLVIANWKMYVESPDTAKAFGRGFKRKTGQYSNVSVVLAPPFPLLHTVHSALGGAAHIAAQTVSPHESGAHTGEVSAAMLAHVGASFVIIGHSERRAAGESDEHIAAALQRTAAAGLIPVLCIGEKQRDASGGHFNEIEQQLSSALAGKQLKRLVVAYEPVWAIGASQAMSPADVQETAIFIRKILADILGRPAALKTAVLYGGSVDGTNARALLHEGGVAGFLVGRASAELDTFLPILDACQ